MKKILAIASLAIFTACGSNSSNERATKDSTQASGNSMQTSSAINSPYAIGYSSSFEMGDNKNAEAILTLWKDFDNGDLTAHKEIFADSLTLIFADGSMMSGPKDSVLAAGQNYRTSLGKAESTVAAIAPLRSKDKDENWTVIWGKEIETDKKGKIDSFHLQESWRFNKDGKADLMLQYRRAALPAK